MNKKTGRMIKISLLSAIALVLMYFDFPVLPMFPWLKIDLSDVPALLGAFGFGPLAGITIELMKNLLILVTKGTQTGFVGECANFLIGCSLVLPASLVYHRKKSKKNAIIGMIIGAVLMEGIAIIANVYFLLPLYGTKVDVTNYILAGLLPFNGIKALLVSVATYILYKKVSVSVFKAEPNFGSIEKVQKSIK